MTTPVEGWTIISRPTEEILKRGSGQVFVGKGVVQSIAVVAADHLTVKIYDSAAKRPQEERLVHKMTVVPGDVVRIIDIHRFFKNGCHVTMTRSHSGGRTKSERRSVEANPFAGEEDDT